MRVAVAFLMLSSVALGQVRISGPTTAAPGTLVELRATGAESTAASRAWLTTSDLAYREYESSQVLVFATLKPGIYEFALIAVSIDAENKPAVSITKHRVVVGNGPQPPPEPNPPNPPSPPVPDTDRWGLVRVARETAPKDRPDERAKVRANLRSVASQIAAGTLRGVKESKDKLRALNRESVGSAAADDHPWHQFFLAVQQRLDVVENDGSLTKTVESWQAAYSDIARGLE